MKKAVKVNESLTKKCLRKLLEANNEQIFYKTPSFIHKVNYDQIVNELWETDLTKDDKNNIGNITTPHRRDAVSHFEGGLPLPESLEEGCAKQQEIEKEEKTNMQYLIHLKHHQ